MSSQFPYFHVVYSLEVRIETRSQTRAKMTFQLRIVIVVD